MNNLINYFKFLVELLGIDPPDLVIKQDGSYYKNGIKTDFEKQPTKARTLFKEGYSDVCIFIDLDMHKYKEEYLSLTHEIRHAYQIFAIKNDDIEPSKYTDIWKKELANYNSYGSSDYSTQEIELDANAFTSVIIKKVFDREIEVEFKNKRFYQYYNYIDNDFSDEEIEDCMQEVGFYPFIN